MATMQDVWNEIDSRIDDRLDTRLGNSSSSSSGGGSTPPPSAGGLAIHNNLHHEPPLAIASDLTAHIATLASADDLGHIRVGDGLSIDVDGILSVTTTDLLSFLDLSDTPANYASAGGFLVQVNAGASALEFVDGSTLYAAADHDHDGVYLTQGEADLIYATIDHNHTGVYSPVGHNHDGVYSPLGHTHTFLNLTDTPSDYVSDASKLVRVNSGETALEFVDGSTLYAALGHNHDTSYAAISHTHTFLSLTDTPSAYTSSGSFLLRVNAGATAVEFVDGSTLYAVTGHNHHLAYVLKAGDTMTGDLTIQKATALLKVYSTTGGANLTIQSDTGNANANFDGFGQVQLNWRKMVNVPPLTALLRWAMTMTSTTEAGGDVGSNLVLLRRHDDGSTFGNPALAVERLTGFIGVNRPEATALYMVDISGSFRVETTTGGVATLGRNDNTVALNESLGKVEFIGNDGDLSTQFVFGNIEVQALTAITADVASGKMLFRTTGLTAGTGPVERLGLGLVKPLTDAATNLFEVTLNAGEMAGGAIIWTIVATDGTNHQAYTGMTTYAVVNKAGVYTSTITQDAANDAKAVSSGTLTAAWSVLTGTNKVTIRVTPTGSLTETTYRILYSIHSNSPQSISVL